MRLILLAGLSALASAALALPALASPITGPDVSSFQHPNGLSIAWSSVKAAGQAFVFVKATESTNYTNPYYAQDVAEAAKAGMMHGAYEFAHPDVSAVAQAQYFAGVIGSQNLRGDLPPVLDLEQTGGLSPAQLITWVGQWLTTVRSLTHRTPMIYVSPSFWQTYLGNTRDYSNYPLWDADWTFRCSGTPWLPGGWATFEFWQYSDNGTIKLANGSSTTSDEDCFNGTMTALDQVGLAAATPFSVTAVPGAQSATVSWNAYPTATSYTISSTSGATYTEPATATSATLTGLINGQPYAFSVTAKLANGTTESTGWGTTIVPAVQDRLSLTATPNQLYPGLVTLAAHVVTPAGAPLAGVPVHLAATWQGQPTPADWGSGNTDSNGNFSWVHSVGQSANFQGSILDSNPYAYSQMLTPWVPVSILPKLTFSASTTAITAGNKVTFSGTLAPSLGNDAIAVQALFGGAWHNAAYATTNSSGAYSTFVYYGTSGSFPMRVVAAANSVHAGGALSGSTVTVTPATITVTAAANPASASLFSYVPVSGTVSPVGARTVMTLQADIGGAWHNVGSATASSTGAYTIPMWAGLLGTFPVRVLAAANTAHYAGISPAALLTVKPAGPVVNGVSVSAYAPTPTATAGRYIGVRGLVVGGEAGDRAIVQVWLYNAWHNASAVFNVASNGTFAASVYCGHTGNFPLRVVLEPNTKHGALGSNIFHIAVN